MGLRLKEHGDGKGKRTFEITGAGNKTIYEL